MFQRLLSLALIAGTVTTAGHALAQELTIERPVGDGQAIDLGRSPTATQELPKASGFPELHAPDEPPLPYVKEDTETIVLPPPANAVDPEPAKPVLKEPAKPVVKVPAKPVVKAPAKPAVKSDPAPAPKIVVKPKPAVPLPRTKPNSIAKQSKPAKKAALPKAAVPKKPVLKQPVTKAPVQTTVIPKTFSPKNIVPKTPESEAPVQKAVVPKTLAPKILVPRTSVSVTPVPDIKTPRDAEIEVNQLESIPSVSASATPPLAESGPILDIPIVGVEVAPEPEEQSAAPTPQKRKSNRVDRN